jgi:ketosteroid isomerase-like protein
MSIELPATVAAYFAADKGRDAEAVSRCFTDDAIVKDEGNTYTGRQAIHDWMASSSAKYTYTVEPFSLEAEGRRKVVTAHLAGDFPGSPVDLRYFFVLDGGRIAELEIIP